MKKRLHMLPKLTPTRGYYKGKEKDSLEKSKSSLDVLGARSRPRALEWVSFSEPVTTFLRTRQCSNRAGAGGRHEESKP